MNDITKEEEEQQQQQREQEQDKKLYLSVGWKHYYHWVILIIKYNGPFTTAISKKKYNREIMIQVYHKRLKLRISQNRK